MTSMETHLEIRADNLVMMTREAYYNTVDYLHYVYKDSSELYKRIFLNKKNPQYQPYDRIKSEFPFLGGLILIVDLAPTHQTVMHVDKKEDGFERGLSMNIPISGCTKDVITEIYEPNDNMGFIGGELFLQHIPGTPVPRKIAEYAITDSPIVLNTSFPHRILTGAFQHEPRVVVSWTIAPGWTLEQIEKFLKDTNNITSST